MKHVPIRLGPLALLLAVICICLTTLSILSFTTGQADMRLAERYAETVKTRYELEAKGMRAVRDVCEGKGAAQSPDGIFITAGDLNEPHLSIVLKQKGGRWEISQWLYETPWAEDTRMDGIWTGE